MPCLVLSWKARTSSNHLSCWSWRGSWRRAVLLSTSPLTSCATPWIETLCYGTRPWIHSDHSVMFWQTSGIPGLLWLTTSATCDQTGLTRNCVELLVIDVKGSCFYYFGQLWYIVYMLIKAIPQMCHVFTYWLSLNKGWNIHSNVLELLNFNTNKWMIEYMNE